METNTQDVQVRLEPVIKTLDEVKKDHVVDTLNKLDWRMNATAKALKVDRKTLYRMLKAWGITESKPQVIAQSGPQYRVVSATFDGVRTITLNELI